ncbi:MAG: carboxypeptidase-like regulatory domain-containing protein [Terriglobales bacterium]
MSAWRSKLHPAAAVLLLLTLAAIAQQAPQLGRSVSGTVYNALDQPLASAIVYLENARTKQVHTVITGTHGTYAFHQLKPGVTYQVHAEWQHHRSPVRTDSQYVSRSDVRLDLKIPIS